MDQMHQAVRSYKQNIVEGISVSTVYVEMCIKPIGIVTQIHQLDAMLAKVMKKIEAPFSLLWEGRCLKLLNVF